MKLPKSKLKQINKDEFIKLANTIKNIDNIKRLPNHRGVKLSSTLSGQRELIREMRNKINELVDAVTNLQK